MKLRELALSPQLIAECRRMEPALRGRRIVVTGSQGGEGVSTLANALAFALSGSGRILLAEGNLRSPCLALELGLTGAGIAQWEFDSPLPLQTVSERPNLAILTAGKPAAGTDDAAIAERLSKAAEMAHAMFDTVIWDCPPLTTYPDLLAVGPKVDGAVVVVEMDRSRADGLHFLRDALDRAEIPLLGSMLNRSGRYWPRALKSYRATVARA